MFTSSLFVVGCGCISSIIVNIFLFPLFRSLHLVFYTPTIKIHLRMQLIMPYLKSIMPRLPGPAGARISASVREVCRALKTTPPPIFGSDSSTKSRKKKRKVLVKKPTVAVVEEKIEEVLNEDDDVSESPENMDNAAQASPLPTREPPKFAIAISVDGSAALVAYRRLLELLCALKREQNEMGRVGVFPCTITAWDDDLASSRIEGAEARKVVQRITKELLISELTVFPAGCLPLTKPHATGREIVRNMRTVDATALIKVVDPRSKILPLQRNVAANRLVLWWRRFLAFKFLQGNLIPLRVAALMGRPGILAGRGGGLKARRMHWSASLIMCSIAHCIGGLCDTISRGKQGVTLSQVVHERAQVLVGMPTLADRFVVDLCFNVNNLQVGYVCVYCIY
jgi:hypothetical protein